MSANAPVYLVKRLSTGLSIRSCRVVKQTGPDGLWVTVKDDEHGRFYDTTTRRLGGSPRRAMRKFLREAQKRVDIDAGRDEAEASVWLQEDTAHQAEARRQRAILPGLASAVYRDMLKARPPTYIRIRDAYPFRDYTLQLECPCGQLWKIPNRRARTTCPSCKRTRYLDEMREEFRTHAGVRLPSFVNWRQRKAQKLAACS